MAVLTKCGGCILFIALVGKLVQEFLFFSIWPWDFMWKEEYDCGPLALAPASAPPPGVVEDRGCRGNSSTPEDFAKKGYLVVKGFLSEEERVEISKLIDSVPFDSETKPGTNNGANGGYKDLLGNGIDIFQKVPTIWGKFAALVNQINEQTDVEVTSDPKRVSVNQAFHVSDASKSDSVIFSWHQDTETFIFKQNFRDLLLFYLMIVKPDPREAGLMVAPFDTMLERCPKLHKLVNHPKGEDWHSCWSFHPINKNLTVLVDDMTDRKVAAQFNLNEIGCTPELAQGDLLLFRGDMPHATQPHKGYRVSMQLKWHTRRPFNIPKLMTGGRTKFSFMANQLWTFPGVLDWERTCEEFPKRSDLDQELLKVRLHFGMRWGFAYRQAFYDYASSWLHKKCRVGR